MDILVILISLVLLMVLTLRKFPVPLAVLLSVTVIAVLTGSNLLETISSTYMGGVADFIRANWILLLMGTILSRVMDLTGAASSIGNFLTDKIGTKRVVPAIIITGGALAYGGINGLALSFALYPIALEMFRATNLPRYLIPSVLTSALFTWVMLLPGAPVIVSSISQQYLGTTGTAGALIGIVSALFMIVYQFIYFSRVIKKVEAAGDGFIADEDTIATLKRSDDLRAAGKLPNPILASIPLLSILVIYNVLHFELWVAILVGTLIGIVALHKTIDNLLPIISGAVNDAAIMTLTAGTVVGIGSVISSIPGFNEMIGSIVEFSQRGGNPVLIFGGATLGLSALLTNGMVGILTSLSTLGEAFLNLGVNPDLLHRIGIIASGVLNCVPYSGGIVALFALTGISFKDGYKHVFKTSIIPGFLALVLAIIMATFLY